MLFDMGCHSNFHGKIPINLKRPGVGNRHEGEKYLPYELCNTLLSIEVGAIKRDK